MKIQTLSIPCRFRRRSHRDLLPHTAKPSAYLATQSNERERKVAAGAELTLLQAAEAYMAA